MSIRVAPPPVRRGNIVVLDDELAIRMLFQVTLEGRGHVVTTAATVAEALAACAKTMPDVVIVDMFLPEGSGVDVITTLRRTCRTARIIAITGGGAWGGFEVLATAKEGGADVTLRKPVPSNVVVEAVEELLRARDARS
jgi:CheY-like chemotaxis protein